MNIMGSYLFEFLGVLAKWVVNLLVSLFNGKKPKSFSEIWNGEKDFSPSELLLYGFINTVLGAGVLFIVIEIINWLDRRNIL